MNRIRTYCCLISKISNSVGRKDNFLAKARKVSFMPTELDIFDIPQHYILILYVYIPTAIKNASQKKSQYLFVFLTKGVILVGTL